MNTALRTLYFFAFILMLSMIGPMGICEDFIRVYQQDQIVFEAPVTYSGPKALPSDIQYRIVLFRLAIQSATISISSGDVYENAKMKLALPSGIVLGANTPDRTIREAWVHGSVTLEPEIQYEDVLVKAFKNFVPDAEAVPDKYGRFNLTISTAPGDYFIACYVKRKEEKFTLQSDQTLKLVGTTFVGKSTPTVLMNFKDTNLYFVLQYLSERTGVTFIVDDALMAEEGKKLKQTVTIVNAQPVTLEEAFNILKSILALKDIGLIRSGKVWKVTTLEKVMRGSHEVKSGRDLSDISQVVEKEDCIVTHVIPLKYTQAITLRHILEPLVSTTGKVIHEASANRLVITDYSSNLDKILKIVMALDVPVTQEVARIYFVKYMAAEKLQEVLKSILASGGLQAIQQKVIRIISAPQARALVVLASEETHQRISHIIETLDTQVLSEEITVAYPVKYNNAEKLMEIFSKLYGAPSKETPWNSAAMFYADTITNTLLIRTTQTVYTKEIIPLLEKLDVARGEHKKSFVYRLSNANAEYLAKQLSLVYPPGGEKEKDVPTHIVADKTTNSLIISSNSTHYENIRNTIQELDIETKQVFIEIILLEVEVTDLLNFGVDDWIYEDSPAFGHAGTINTRAEGDPYYRIFRTKKANDKVDVFLQLLAKVTTMNVLAAPRIYTANNEEAKIHIGKEVPLITSRQEEKQQGSETTEDNIITQNFEYRKTGLITTVTPFINNQNEVTIKVVQEDSDVNTASTVANAVELKQNTISTQVKVKNGETVILGGFFKNKEEVTVSKIPFLGDIPLIGLLFTSQKHEYKKNELVIFITPRVVDIPSNAPKMMKLKTGALNEEREIALPPEKIKWQQKPRRWERERRD